MAVYSIVLPMVLKMISRFEIKNDPTFVVHITSIVVNN